MRPWARYLVGGVVGVIAGTGAAAYAVRAGALSSGKSIGAWTTGTDYGSAEQSALTRAVVARRGLLALPAREARYYNASVDDAGRPLGGRCRYRITGGALLARWWSNAEPNTARADERGLRTARETGGDERADPRTAGHG